MSMGNFKLIGGNWPSPFYYRVKWGLELKGLKYEDCEEDLTNKSPMFLKYTPIYKKIPVLVHNGKPICESLIILEYLEDMFPNLHPLMSKDPYERAQARFWGKYSEEKGPSFWKLYRTTGEEQAKAKEDVLGMLRNTEEHYCYQLKITKFFGGDKIGLADISLGSYLYWLLTIEDVTEMKLFEANNFPNLYRWLNDFKEDPIIKNNLPDKHQMFLVYKNRREMLIQVATK